MTTPTERLALPELLLERSGLQARLGDVSLLLVEVNQEYNRLIIEMIELNAKIREIQE